MLDSGSMADMRSTVLVTGPEYRKGEACFTAARGLDCVRAPDAEAELASAIRGSEVRYVIVGNRKYSGPLYDALPAGGVIARMGVGHDGIDKGRATAAQLLCTNTPGVLDQSVAEHAMLLIAAAARQLLPALASMASGAWTAAPGRDLYGKRLAIVGCGAIGRALARIAALGYGMQVAGCTRPNAPAPSALEHFHFVTNEFAEAVRGADFVSLHMPAKPENARFINRERLEQMEKAAWLVNTARGPIVDPIALRDALQAGRIAGAALDVTDPEPLPPDDPLLSAPNLIVLPHIGSATWGTRRRMAELACDNLLAGLDGRALPYCVNAR